MLVIIFTDSRQEPASYYPIALPLIKRRKSCLKIGSAKKRLEWDGAVCFKIPQWGISRAFVKRKKEWPKTYMVARERKNVGMEKDVVLSHSTQTKIPCAQEGAARVREGVHVF